MTTPNSVQQGKARKLYTPASGRIKVKTPHTRTIRASRDEGDGAEHSFKELLGHQWHIHGLSPLFNFHNNPQMLRRYARSLDMAFTQSAGRNSSHRESEMKSSLEAYLGLSFHPDDEEAVRIEIRDSEGRGGKESVVLKAFLLSVDVGQSVFPSHMTSRFSYYPVVIVSGNKARTTVFLDWLEQHFDCRTSPLELTDLDLRWMLAAGCSQASLRGDSKKDVLLQYDLTKACAGINEMNCSFEFDFCCRLWQGLNGDSQAKDTIADDEVKRFITALEEHIEYTMHILVSKLKLSEVGTPQAFLSSKGKFKMFSHDSVYPTLHLICDMARERYTQFYQCVPSPHL